MPRSSRAESPFPYLAEDVVFPFPRPESADSQGIVCMGGNLSPGLLLSAYRQGLFPWFSKDEPILWWSPDPRFVVFPEKLHVSATMRKVLRRLLRTPGFELSLDRDFQAVIRACSSSPRPGQDGTWITESMIEAYIELHRLGFAHSAEARLEGRLIGGLYGVSLGSIFFGESMFSRENDASKAVFIPLALKLKEEGFTLIDSQVYTEHVSGLGGVEIAREEYLGLLGAALEAPTRRGDWGKLLQGFPDSAGLRELTGKQETQAHP